MKKFFDFNRTGAFWESAKKFWRDTKPFRDDLAGRAREVLKMSTFWKVAKILLGLGLLMLALTLITWGGFALFGKYLPPTFHKIIWVVLGTIWVMGASACALLGAVIFGLQKGWKKGLYNFILMESGIILLPLLIWGISKLWDYVQLNTPWKSVGTYTLYALGAIALAVAIYFGRKKLKGTGMAGASLDKKPGEMISALVKAGVIVFAVAAIFEAIAISMGRTIWWFNPTDAKIWAIVGATIGALVCVKKGWAPKIVGGIILYTAAQTAWGSFYKTFHAEEIAGAQTRLQEIRQRAAETPASEKFWTLRRQNHTFDGILEKTYTRYNAEVVQSPDGSIKELTMLYVQNGTNTECRLTYATVPREHRTFRLWRQEGTIDKWVGEMVCDEGYHLRLELDGKLTPF